MGSITITFVPAEASTATVTSEAPCRAASQWSSIVSNFETMFSSTTIEFDTSTPVERPIASSVTVLRDCPQSRMKKRLITTVTGIVIATITVVRMLTRKMKRIAAQIRIACQTLESAALTDSTTFADSSETHVIAMPPGNVAAISSKRRRHSRTTSTVLPSDFFTILIAIPGLPSRRTRSRTSSVAMRTVAMSRRSTRAPLAPATSSASICATSGYSASKRTAYSMSPSRRRPPGRLSTPAPSAVATSPAVSPAATSRARSSSTHTSRSLPPTTSTRATPRTVAKLSATSLSA